VAGITRGKITRLLSWRMALVTNAMRIKTCGNSLPEAARHQNMTSGASSLWFGGFNSV
jgi:hypothetical protein